MAGPDHRRSARALRLDIDRGRGSQPEEIRSSHIKGKTKMSQDRDLQESVMAELGWELSIDAAQIDLVATMLERRDFKGCRRKTLPIFVSGADHAFQASFERQTAYSSPAPSGYKLARI